MRLAFDSGTKTLHVWCSVCERLAVAVTAPRMATPAVVFFKGLADGFRQRTAGVIVLCAACLEAKAGGKNESAMSKL